MPRAKYQKKDRSGPSRTSHTFNFIGLPPELRNEIYRIVFPPHKSHIALAQRYRYFSGFDPYRKLNKNKNNNWTSLLATNKQIRNEASRILFGSRIFYFSAQFVLGKDNFQLFFTQVGKLNARNLTRIIIPMVGMMVADHPLARKDGRFTYSQDSCDMIQTIKRNCPNLRMFVVIVSFLNSPSLYHANWLHLDFHEAPSYRFEPSMESLPKMDKPRRATPPLKKRILAPSDP